MPDLLQLAKQQLEKARKGETLTDEQLATIKATAYACVEQAEQSKRIVDQLVSLNEQVESFLALMRNNMRNV